MNPPELKSIRFTHFKALEDFKLELKPMNILVGPNNSGKSTVISALRLLSNVLKPNRSIALVKSAGNRKAAINIQDALIPFSTVNVRTNYADKETKISYHFSDNRRLEIMFPIAGLNHMRVFIDDTEIQDVAEFRSAFKYSVAVVPILGPVEQEEYALTPETVRRELYSHRACRHFRNYWHHFPEHFEEFRTAIQRSWKGMDIERPELSGEGKALFMNCKENNFPRELFWAGYGFQIWCQLITHIVRSQGADLLVVDEPEVYLHPQVQRQILGILRQTGNNTVIATHSVEIIGEADRGEIVLVDKSLTKAQRLWDIAAVQQVVAEIGSVHNVTLTQLARDRKVLFVEGSADKTIIKRLADRLGLHDLAMEIGITIIGGDGQSTKEYASVFKRMLAKTVDEPLQIATIVDRDYLCDEEVRDTESRLGKDLAFFAYLGQKEIENYLTTPMIIAKALSRALSERAPTSGQPINVIAVVESWIECYCRDKEESLRGLWIENYLRYHRSSGVAQSAQVAVASTRFNNVWRGQNTRHSILPGKELLAFVRERAQSDFYVTLTDSLLISQHSKNTIPADMQKILQGIERFRVSRVAAARRHE